MRGARGIAHDLPVFKGRHQQKKVIQMPGCQPGVIGHVDVTGFHRFSGKATAQMQNGLGHGVNVARSAGDGLRKHEPIGIKDTCGDIATLANDGTKRGSGQYLPLFLNKRKQAIPHYLQARCGNVGGHARLLFGC